jgi:hypothetical protein
MATLKKKDLAAALGITPATVLYRQRLGMPVDSVEAAEEWVRTYSTPGAGAPNKVTEDIAILRRRRAEAATRRAELELGMSERRLISRVDAENAIFARARAERDAWLALPARLAPQLASEFKVSQAALFEALSKAIRVQLAEFAGPIAL